MMISDLIASYHRYRDEAYDYAQKFDIDPAFKNLIVLSDTYRIIIHCLD
jgi:hypothetical protein